ncbi:MAG: HAMP domain-containing sensor histidine kinase [Bacteroidales bacterium]|nr:HAMP domain-containing sensor histidine kinase [Bacteroidales bacterium]
MTAVLLASVSCQRTEKPRCRILVIHEFPFREQPSKMVREAFLKEYSDTTRYEFHFVTGADAAYDRVLRPAYFDDQFLFLGRTLSKIKRKPDMVIVLGDLLSQTACGMDHPWLNDLPVLCLGVKYPEWRDSCLCKKKNFVVMVSDPEPKKNVDFIRDLGGNSWIVTGIDQTFIDEKVRSSIMEEMGSDTANYITNLNFEAYEHLVGLSERDQRKSTFIPINQENTGGVPSDSLYNAHFRIPGIFQIGSNHSTFLRLKDDVYIDKSFAYNLGPYFSNSARYFNLPIISALNANIGGYLTTWNDMARQAHSIVDQLLDGKVPASIPVQKLSKDYWLDWRLARRLHPFASDFPSYVKFVNLPWSERNRINMGMSRHGIPALLLLILVIAFTVPVLMMSRSSRIHAKLVEEGHKAETAQKKVENLLTAIHAFPWEIIAGNTVRFGEDFARACGLDLSQFPLEMTLSQIVEGRDELRAAIFDTTLQKNSVEVVINLQSGVTHAFIVYVNHMTDEKGNLLCNGFVVFNDEAYEAEQIRKEAYRLAEETSVKESFIASMSHEIRTPLNSIVGFADLLSKQNNTLSPEDRAEYAGYINSNMEHLLSLLDDVINYSDKSENMLSLELSRHDVGSLMENVYLTHSVIMPDNLELRFEKGPAAAVMVNRSAFLQIMSNLMSNAIKFTSEGSITIGWEVREGPDGSIASLYVEDTGCGISPENQELIFRKFFKTDIHTSGAGIGLALCQKLARGMDARIELQSELGKGSRFSLILNCVDV